jgi:predicted NAD/FAD-binding protein
MRIAVIGSGISGLASAYLLREYAEVHLFETSDRLGGHSHTVDVQFAEKLVPVDTGFIVYNPLNYPNLMALFDELKVPSKDSDMSFSVSLGNGSLEYEGSLKGLLAQPSNFAKRRYWSMLSDIVRFYRTAPQHAYNGPQHETLSEFVKRQAYGEAFVNDHLIPMGAAIWSADIAGMMSFPVRTFMRFMENHKLLNFIDRPQWRTVSGGSREYVNRIGRFVGKNIHLSTDVAAVRRAQGGVMLTIEGQGEVWFDKAVMAAHADQSLALISDAHKQEYEILSAFRFQPNLAVLHSDPRLMPKRKGAWASWNYMGYDAGQNELCLTYWMNRLQSLDPACPLFETLNPVLAPRAELTHGSYHYRHPIFDEIAIAAQPKLSQIQGNNHLFFAGAWSGYGFHEDGLKSAVAIAKTIGVEVPWASNVMAYDVMPPKLQRIG